MAGERLRDAAGRFIAEVRAVGLPDEVTRRWLVGLPAFRRLEAVAREGVDVFAVQAVRAIEWRIADAAALGVDSSRWLTNVAMGQAEGSPVGTLFGQVNAGAVEQLVGALQAESPLASLPGLSRDVTERVATEIVRGLANGTNSRVIGRRVARAADIPAVRAANIARSELHRAHREASRLQYQANSMTTAWRWVSALGPRTCSACFAMHGRVFPLDEPMPAHPSCRCTTVPVVDRASLRELGIDAPDFDMPTGEAIFAGLSASEQRQILGPGKHAAYEAGEITLADTVKQTTTREWGTSTTVASLAQARAS